MGMGMIRWEWEGNGNKKVIPAHLYSEVERGVVDLRPFVLRAQTWRERTRIRTEPIGALCSEEILFTRALIPSTWRFELTRAEPN